MNKNEIINRLIDSDVNRPVEVALSEETLNSSKSTRYLASLRYIGENEFYIILPAIDTPKAPTDNALKGENIAIPSLDTEFEITFSFYKQNLGYVVGISNSGVNLRRFPRVPFHVKAYLSINRGGDEEQEEIEVHALNLSSSGIAIRRHRGTTPACGIHCQLKIPDADFPGYDPSEGAATLNGEIVRIMSDENLPEWEELGIAFKFDDPTEELLQTGQIDIFCWHMAFVKNRGDQNIRQILNLTSDLNATLDLDTILFRTNISAAKLVSSQGSAILLFDDEKRYLEFRVATGEKAPVLSRIRIAKKEGGIAWWVAQTGEPAVVNDVNSDERFTKAIDKMTNFETQSILAVPIIWEGEVIGVLEAVNKMAQANYTPIDLQLFTLLANQIAKVIRNAQIVGRYENYFTNSIELIVKAIESTGVLAGLMSPGHCWRVVALATSIGQQFGLNEEDFDNLYYGALLHDIGFFEPQNQTLIQLDYASQDNNYDAEDFIRAHPVMGANIVKGIQMLREAAPIIRHHHEHFDGSGYPDGLAAENIPLGARIVGVVEAYEEMLHGQEEDLTAQKQAQSAIQEAAGTRFDPEVVEAFIDQVTQSH